MTIKESWQALAGWIAAECPEFEPQLKPGAGEEELVALEKRLGLMFPEEFRRFYGAHNGQADGADGIFDERRVKQLLDYRTEEGPGRYGIRLWMLVTFHIWKEIVLDP